MYLSNVYQRNRDPEKRAFIAEQLCDANVCREIAKVFATITIIIVKKKKSDNTAR